MTWTEKKSELIHSGYLDMAFLEAAEAVVYRELAGLPGDPRSGDEYEYEPLLVHQHTASVSQLLDRVLAYRREARDLEILAVKVAMDYRLWDITAKIDEELDLSRLGLAVLKRSIISQRQAAAAFGRDGGLEPGFEALHLGRAEEVALEIDMATNQRELLRARYAAQRAYQQVYREKHTQIGNAHNYAERAIRLVKLFLQDLREAYTKSEAIAIGIRTIWGKDFKVPSPHSPSFVDELVDWNRDVVRFLEYLTQHEYQLNIVVPLVQPWAEDGSALVDRAAFEEALAKSDEYNPLILEFNLQKNHLSGLNARLLSVGLSFGNEVRIVEQSGSDRNATLDNYARLRATVTIPAQQYVDAKASSPKSFHLGSVGLFGGGAPQDVFSGPSVRYADPFGTWRILVNPVAVYKDSSLQLATLGMDSRAVLRDLKLHLSLSVLEGS
jgi:hypothetical protein